jgi:hypothetical protein
MGADAAHLAQPHGYGRAPPRRAALALTLGLHLLVAVLWLQERRTLPPESPRVVTILLQPTVPPRLQPLAPARAPASPRAAAPVRAVPRHVVPSASATPPDAAAPATPAPAPAPAITPPQDAPAATAPPAQAAPGTAATPSPPSADSGFAAGLARRQAGRIDRELRNGKSGVPREADTTWARFQRGLEAAHVDRSMSARMDSYTSPDGVVIYRQRVGGRTLCYRTGSVGLGVAGARGVNDAGPVQCPSGVTWTPEN